MAFSRITDPKSTGSGKNAKPNLTLKQLLHVVRQHCTDEDFLRHLAAEERAIDAHCRPIRELRNKRIGHLDLETALKYRRDPLPNISRAHIVKALRLVAEFMNAILGYYTDAYADFVPGITGPASDIVHGLKEFLRLSETEYERRRREMLTEGE